MKTLTSDQREKLEKTFFERIKNVSKEDVKKAIDETKKKFDTVEEKMPDVLKELIVDIKDMWSMVVDYYRGIYTEAPWGTIASMAVALLYFASPIDLIPDFIPVLGYIDDAFIITLALKLIGDDLEKYREWKNKQQITGVVEIDSSTI